MRGFSVCLVVLAVAASGCGGGGGGGAGSGAADVPIEQKMKPASTAELKARLESIAKTGEGGSATAGIRPAVEDLKKTDPKKAEALLPDLTRLERAADPASTKAAAKA